MKISPIFVAPFETNAYLCRRNKNSGSPLRRAAVIARLDCTGFFIAQTQVDARTKILAVVFRKT